MTQSRTFQPLHRCIKHWTGAVTVYLLVHNIEHISSYLIEGVIGPFHIYIWSNGRVINNSKMIPTSKTDHEVNYRILRDVVSCGTLICRSVQESDIHHFCCWIQHLVQEQKRPLLHRIIPTRPKVLEHDHFKLATFKMGSTVDKGPLFVNEKKWKWSLSQSVIRCTNKVHREASCIPVIRCDPSRRS